MRNWKHIAKGAATYIPPLEWWRRRRARGGATASARYCYTVWLRHLIWASRSGLPCDPRVVAEFGPGDSIGTGLCALLTGAERYLAVDAVPYAADTSRNLRVLDELITLLRERTDLPGDSEFPRVFPKLDSYSFPGDLLTAERLERTLAPDRIQDLRRDAQSALGGAGAVQYVAPWTNAELVAEASVDVIFSQAVLEHVDDLEGLYAAARRWIKADGWCSHTIDFCSHSYAREWNGHWAYSEFVWKLVRGTRPYAINRIPREEQLNLARSARFEIVRQVARSREGGIRREQLARRWRDISADDLHCPGCFVQMRPRVDPDA